MKFLNWLILTFSDLFKGSRFKSSRPWAKMEIIDIEKDGQLKIKYSHNDAFIEYLNNINWKDGTEDDMVQSYLLSLGVMAALADGSLDNVDPSNHPGLSSENGRIVK